MLALMTLPDVTTNWYQSCVSTEMRRSAEQSTFGRLIDVAAAWVPPASPLEPQSFCRAGGVALVCVKSSAAPATDVDAMVTISVVAISRPARRSHLRMSCIECLSFGLGETGGAGPAQPDQ